eukprot:c14876_g1_i1.p1 GENE.c14876_g1_i1~~c14876_g1_i1.p1  ORF type:complete len:642 (+),score=170.88 c14876_g1_i1:61-1986(+)
MRACLFVFAVAGFLSTLATANDKNPTINRARELITMQDAHLQIQSADDANRYKKQAYAVIVELNEDKRKLENEAVKDRNDHQGRLDLIDQQLTELSANMRQVIEHFQDNLNLTNVLEQRMQNLTDTLGAYRQNVTSTGRDDLAWAAIAKEIETSSSREKEYYDNSKILDSWTRNLIDLENKIVLPGSKSDPMIDMVDELLELIELMRNSSLLEAQIGANGKVLLERHLTIKAVLAARPPPPVETEELGSQQDVQNTIEELHQEILSSSTTRETQLMAIDRYSARAQHAKQQRTILEASFQIRQVSREQQMTLLTQLSRDLTAVAVSWCPHGCSGNGMCVNNQCMCDARYDGSDCASMKLKALMKDSMQQQLQPVNSNAPQVSVNASRLTHVFDFGPSTNTFVSSQKFTCEKSLTALSVSVWTRVTRGPSTIFSYATATGDSEFLLWMDDSCEAVYLWINSLSRKDLQGVQVGNFSHTPLCDTHWHHISFSWDGSVGESRTFLDGKFHERHWNVFMGEKILPDGTFVLGQNQVHTKEKHLNTLNTDAYLGQMSDLFVVEDSLTPMQANVMASQGTYTGRASYVHWSLTANSTIPINGTGPAINDPAPLTKIRDQGSLGIDGLAVGGTWIPMNLDRESCTSAA